jgi:S1-C subfamily serine protease
LPAFLRPRVLVPGLVLLAAAGAAGCGSSSGTTSAVSSAAGSDASPTHLQSQYEQVVRNVLPSVVEIETASSTGSGVVYNGNGDIVTNEHVVGDASSVEVLTAAGSPLAATVVGKFAPDDREQTEARQMGQLR